MREKKNCDCGIRERKKNKGGRRTEGGMTFRGRRREEWRQKGGTLCDSSKGWGKKRKKGKETSIPVTIKSSETQADNQNKSSGAIANGHSTPT